MTTQQYNNLVSYARACLFDKKTDLTLAPHDLVANAFLALPCFDMTEIKVLIRKQAQREHFDHFAFRPYNDQWPLAPVRKSWPVETRRHCKQCGEEKGLAAFYSRIGRAGVAEILNTCKLCVITKYTNYYQTVVKTNPEKYAAKIEGSKLYKRMVKADPVKGELYRIKRREYDKRRQNDPEWRARRAENERKRIERLRADPEYVAKQKERIRLRDIKRRQDKSLVGDTGLTRLQLRSRRKNELLKERIKNSPELQLKEQERNRRGWERRKERLRQAATQPSS